MQNQREVLSHAAGSVYGGYYGRLHNNGNLNLQKQANSIAGYKVYGHGGGVPKIINSEIGDGVS